MIRRLDLGVNVLQWRDEDSTWRIVDAQQLEDEQAGRHAAGEDAWASSEPGAGITAGQTYVLGQVVDGLPDRVSVGGEDEQVHVVGGIWAATWTAWRRRIVVYVDGQEITLDLARRPHYLTSRSDKPELHDQPSMGWVRVGEGGPRGADDRPD